MIPVKLTLQGLYSYREKQEIDFTKLTQAGLFGIFGSVGSGKSSILEAISFALYSESERLNSHDNRNYNMMNLKSNELLIDFEFKTNDNTRYRFVVKGKRNSRQFNDVKAFSTTAYRSEDSEWIPIDPKRIEQITGLNYKNFRRTIIIPQGRFQEFLQLNPADRTTMLKELFNLSKYELSDKVIRLESANMELKGNINGQLKGIGEIDPSHLEYLKSEIIRLDEAITVQKDKLETHRKHEQELSMLKTLVQKFNKLTIEQNDLLGRYDYFVALENEIKQFESFSFLFHSDLEQLRMVDNNLRKNKEELTQNTKLQADIKHKVDEWQARINSLKPQYELREQLLQTSEELNKILTIRKDETDVAVLKVRVQKGRQILQSCVAEIEEKQKKLENMEKLLDDLKRNLPDLRNLTDIRQAFLEQDGLLELLKEITLKQTSDLDTINGLYESGLEILKETSDLRELSIDKPELPDSCTPYERFVLRFHNDLIRFTDHIAYLEAFLKATEKEIINCEVQLKLQDFALQLHEGKSCPLCGSLNHPSIFHQEDNARQLDTLKAEKQRSEQQKEQLVELLTSLDKFKEQMILTEAQKESVSNKMEKTLNKLLVITKFKNQKDLSREMLDAEFKRYDEENKNIQLTEKEIKKCNDELIIANENKERYTKAIHDLDKEFVEKQSSINLLSKQLKLIKISDFESYSDADLQQLIVTYATNYQTVTTQYQHAEKEHITLFTILNTLIGKIEIGLQHDGTYTKQLAFIQDRIGQKLIEAGNLELATVEAVLQKQLDCESEKQRIERYRQLLETGKKALETLEVEINQRVYDAEEHQQFILLIKTLDNALAEMNRLKGENEKELRQLTTDAERYAILKKEYDRLELRGQDIAELKNLFRSSGFVNYVSTVYLQNLCAAANDRFYQLTRHKLGLELAVDNSFQVRDYMNEGKLRSVKTLSGGQTFQASLSLALSLADSIHKIAGSSENFFFLDEGFGTLDKEALEVVFESLKALRRENRIVGVISHVEEMQQEIETFLKVINHNDQGSVIEASWEML